MFTVWTLISMAFSLMTNLNQYAPPFKPYALNPKTGKYEFVPAPPLFSPQYKQWKLDRQHKMPLGQHYVEPLPKSIDPRIYTPPLPPIAHTPHLQDLIMAVSAVATGALATIAAMYLYLRRKP